MWEQYGYNFAKVAPASASLLGAPLRAGQAVDDALTAKRQELEKMVARLATVPSHPALFLLRGVFSIPKLLYFLRTSPSSDSQELAA